MRLALVLAIGLLAAGCGAGEQQGIAEDAVDAFVADRPEYVAGDTSCTGNPVLGGHRVDVTICAVRRSGGGCDWFRVEFLSEQQGRVGLYRRDAGCTLPN